LYTKQVNLNYTRASTQGWNIWYNFLEASGGSLSVLQLVLDAYIIGDVMSGIAGNMAKFLLGLATIVFDVIFVLQHYVWYASAEDDTDKADVDKGGAAPAAPSKRIPRHLRANSRFEIAIFPTSPVHGLCHGDVFGISNNHNHHTILTRNDVVTENENIPMLRHTTSELSLASSTTN
jgi:PQ loop repeat